MAVTMGVAVPVAVCLLVAAAMAVAVPVALVWPRASASARAPSRVWVWLGLLPSMAIGFLMVLGVTEGAPVVWSAVALVSVVLGVPPGASVRRPLRRLGRGLSFSWRRLGRGRASRLLRRRAGDGGSRPSARRARRASRGWGGGRASARWRPAGWSTGSRGPAAHRSAALGCAAGGSAGWAEGPGGRGMGGRLALPLTRRRDDHSERGVAEGVLEGPSDHREEPAQGQGGQDRGAEREGEEDGKGRPAPGSPFVAASIADARLRSLPGIESLGLQCPRPTD
jgi:hypothetical protein